MKISFTDFWDKFDSHNNFFLDLLSEITGEQPEVVVHPNSADVLIYSCFGSQSHRAFDKNHLIKIFYTGENLRPNFDECTYSFTFDFEDYGGKNIRVPLWMLQLDWYNKTDYENPKYVIPLDDLEDNDFIRNPKTKFCALINNNLFDNRVECMQKLHTYKPVDGYGKPFGNWFYGEKEKMEILSSYKFSICFENSTAPVGGYYTEKLVHAKLSGNVPIYWADEKIGRDFNPKSFINLNDYNSMDKLVERVTEIDQDENLYKSFSEQPLWDKSRDPRNKKEELKESVKNLLNL
jgi:hypothetical protein